MGGTTTPGRLLLAALLAAAGAVPFACAEDKPKPDRTHFGVVFKGNAYAASGRTVLLIGDMQENPVIARRLTLAFDNDGGVSPPRWRVSPSGKAMMLDAPTLLSTKHEFGLSSFFIMYSYPVAQALDHRDGTYTAPAAPPQEQYCVFQFCPSTSQNILDGIFDSFAHDFLGKYQGKDQAFFFSQYEFFYDFVPLPGDGDDYTLFVLANGKLQEALDRHGRDEAKKPLPQGESGRTQLPYPEDAESEVFQGAVTPALGVWKRNKEESSRDMQWALEETIPTPFNERFHAFTKGSTYFILTDSGKVYVSKKPDQGDRKLETLWDNDHYPITAAVQDADTGKVFLFGKARKDDGLGKDFYWELDETVHRHDYDPSLVKPIDTVEPLKTVMEYARFLADQKEIQLPDKGGKEKDK